VQQLNIMLELVGNYDVVWFRWKRRI